MKAGPAVLQRIGEYFREIRLTNDLLMLPSDRSWLAKPPQSPAPKKIVLHLGCNVLRTPHMILVATRILQKLRVDFVSVGGPTYCCGAPFLQDAPEEAHDLGERAAQYMAQFRPHRVVMWCPGCLRNFPKVVTSTLPYQIQHFTDFLVENVERLPLRRPVPRRVALHYHNGSPDTDRLAACARLLLKAVPELELVTTGTDPRLGLQCTARTRHSLGSTWDSILATQLEQAIDQGAEVLAPIHHSCHRMLVHLQEIYPIEVEHYLSLLGHSLGLDYDDLYRKYTLLADVDSILEAARPCLQANQMDVKTAQPLVQKIFVERVSS